MFFEPFTILINGQPTQLGLPIPAEIHHFEVTLNIPLQVPYEQIPAIKQWLNQVVSNLICEYVTYNGVLIPSSELQKF